MSLAPQGASPPTAEGGKLILTYDIKDASEAGKIVAFIILGVVLLIISFMYQKIKALLIDDGINKKTTDEHE